MAGIIKAGSPQATAHAAVSHPYFHLEDLEQRGDQYLADVRKQASKILEDAHQKASRVHREMMDKARKDAMEKAREELDAELQRKLASVEPMLHSTIAQLKQQIQLWQREWEFRTVSLAVGIAEKVIGQQLKNAPEIVLNQIEQALNLAGKQDRLELRLNPNDMEEFKETIELLIEHFGGLTSTVMIPDSAVQRGGCLVRGRYGDIDAQLETQIQRIQEELS